MGVDQPTLGDGGLNTNMNRRLEAVAGVQMRRRHGILVPYYPLSPTYAARII